jgi:phage tail-like protein
MSSPSPLASRSDPFLGFGFELQAEGLVIGSFSEVSGLGAEIDIEEYREGGVNDFVHKLPKNTKYGNLVFRRGMTNSTVLYDWYKKVANGKIERRQITITLLDTQKSPLKNWSFKNAFPVKWNGPDLKSDGNAIAIESVEMAHQGLVWL